METVTLTIDGRQVTVEKGKTVLEAANQHGSPVPYYCYHPGLGVDGSCRVCIVRIEKMPKLQTACSTICTDGMVVTTRSPEVEAARASVFEFLLLNHPLDCPVCDQAGECDLQDLSYAHGLASTRYEEERRTFEPVDIGDKIKLHMTRCILCYRCTYVADQLTDERRHGVLNRGDRAEIGTYIKNAIDNDFSGNMIDVCPVGALTDRTFRFKSRVWFTQPLDAHRDCDKCCGKVVLWTKGEEVLRVTGRKDKYGEVHEFICNECRFERKSLSDWVVEGPRHINRHSVISQNHYEKINLVALKKEVERQIQFQKGKTNGNNPNALQA